MLQRLGTTLGSLSSLCPTTSPLHRASHVIGRPLFLQTSGIASCSKLSRSLPRGTWDSHMHVTDPDRFPLDSKAQYKPPVHTLQDAREFYKSSGIERMVFVQPSIYANDNSCMLEALREVGVHHGRAVVQLDPETIDNNTLQEWHDIGVRGVRVNLVSVGRDLGEQELLEELKRYAKVIRPWNWSLELYVPMKLATPLEKIVPSLGVKVCIDHFGHPPLPSLYDPTKAVDPYSFAGFKSLVKLLEGGRTWLKFSAPYRVTKDPDAMRDLEPIGRELLKIAPERMVYATDWPHTRFETIDSGPFIEKCFEWCGSGTGVADKLFRSNAEELWDVPPQRP